MLDTHVAWLANQGMNFLSTDKNPDRLGNQHPNIVPYQVMPTLDGYIVLSIGNDPTFERFCKLAGEEKLLGDARFKTNADRVSNREFVTNTLNEITKRHKSDWWLTELEKQKIGCGPINTLNEVFSDPHVKAREMVSKSLISPTKITSGSCLNADLRALAKLPVSLPTSL